MSQIQTVENIAELKAMGPSVDGTWAFVGGYYERGDGGGGDFFWDSSSTATADDGMVIDATGVATGRWLRASRNLTDYPAAFWGVMPDSGEDEAGRIQKAMNYTAGRGVLTFSVGDFEVHTTLNNPLASSASTKGLQIRGVSGLRGGEGFTTRFLYRGDTGTALFDLTPGVSASFNIRKLHLSDFVITGQYPTKDHVGLLMGDFRTSTIERVSIRAFKEGILQKVGVGIGYGYYSKISHLDIRSCDIGIRWKSNWNNTPIYASVFSDNRIGVIMEYADTGPTFHGCYFERNSEYGVQVRTSPGLTIDSCYFENNPSRQIGFTTGDNGWRWAQLRVINSYFKLMANADVVYAGGNPKVSGEVATSTGVLVYMLGNIIENQSTGTSAMIRSFDSSYSIKAAVLISNQYRYPNSMDLQQLGSHPAFQRISRIADGPGNVFVFGRQLSPPVAPGTAVATEAQEVFVRGMFRFNSTSGKFQGVASTTVGWEDLH